MAVTSWGLGPASSTTCGTEQKDCGLRHEAATVGNDSSIQSQEVGGRVLGTGAGRAPRLPLHYGVGLMSDRLGKPRRLRLSSGLCLFSLSEMTLIIVHIPAPSHTVSLAVFPAAPGTETSAFPA